jgi:uncharacterized protein (TIGR02145 family)
MRTFLCLLITIGILFSSCKKNDPITENLNLNQNPAITDIDGNAYKTVTIGTQVWMASNLKTTHYKGGNTDAYLIPNVTDNTEWKNLLLPGYCWYDNNAAANKDVYGALYNWYTVDTGNLCPTGWHVPSDAEWTTLTTYLVGTWVAGGTLKETGTSYWISPNTEATNSSGFTALPGGKSYYYDGTFDSLGYNSFWWSSTITGATDAWYRKLFNYLGSVERWGLSCKTGSSVRCVRD